MCLNKPSFNFDHQALGEITISNSPAKHRVRILQPTFDTKPLFLLAMFLSARDACGRPGSREMRHKQQGVQIP